MNFRHSLLFASCIASFALCGETNIVERFDSDAVSGKIANGGKIDPAAGLENGALIAMGNGQSMQYIYEKALQGQPGDKFTVALDYRTTPQFPNGTLMFVIVYNAPKGVKPPASTYIRFIPSHLRWTHRQFTFSLPENTVGARVMLRMAGVKPPASVQADNLRIVSVKDGRAKGIDLESFDVDFSNWNLEEQPLFDHFMAGPGGKICKDVQEAKAGDAFFQACGNNTPMQYALFIDNIKVNPQSSCIFKAFYRTSPAFKQRANGMLIFFYKDETGKTIGQSRFYFSEAKEWKELTHKFTTPEKCAFVDIGLNIRKQPETEWIRLDHLRFFPAPETAK